MYEWIASDGKVKSPPKKKSFSPRSNLNERWNAITRCVFNGDDVYLAAEDLHRDVTTIRTWVRLYYKEGITAIMVKPSKNVNQKNNITTNDVDVLKTKILEL